MRPNDAAADAIARSAFPSRFASNTDPHDVSTDAAPAPIQTVQTALVSVPGVPPASPRSRQNTMPVGRSAGGAALVVPSKDIVVVAQLGLAQISTRPPVSPGRSSHRNVGRREVARDVESGAIARGAQVPGHAGPASN